MSTKDIPTLSINPRSILKVDRSGYIQRVNPQIQQRVSTSARMKTQPFLSNIILQDDKSLLTQKITRHVKGPKI